MGDLEIFDRCPGDISSKSWRYLVVVLEIFDGVLEILIGVLEIFDQCPRDIWSFSRRYLMGIL